MKFFITGFLTLFVALLYYNFHLFSPHIYALLQQLPFTE